MSIVVQDSAARLAGPIAARMRVDSLLRHRQNTARWYRSVVGAGDVAALNREVEVADPVDVALFDDHSVTRAQFASIGASQNKTRVFEAFHRYSTLFNEICRVIAHYAPGHAVDCSVYEADVTDSPFGRHVDAFHNFVIQLVGSKRWLFDETTSMVLRPGDLLFVPYQFSHDVRAVTFSRHLSVSLVSDVMLAENNAASGNTLT